MAIRLSLYWLKKWSLFGMLLVYSLSTIAQEPIVASRLTIQDYYDNLLISKQWSDTHHLIGTYAGWDNAAIFIGGYNYQSAFNQTATKRVYIGSPYSGSPFLNMDFTTGNMGLNTMNPQSYFHGGNNRVFELYNPNAMVNSQSHFVISTGSTAGGTSAGTLTWTSPNSQINKGLAYIGATMGPDATQNASGSLVFATSSGDTPLIKMLIDQTGNVGIGTLSPSEKLTVIGKIKASEIRVNTTGMPDYVFQPDYKQLTLPEIEKYIQQHKHLPEIPSAAEAEKNGLELGEMNKLLLKKIEELTLFLIEKEKENKLMSDRLNKIEKMLNQNKHDKAIH